MSLELLERDITLAIFNKSSSGVLKCLKRDKSRSLRNYLHYAVRTSTLKIVKILVDHGFDINAINWFNLTPLMYSVLNTNSDIMNYLVSKGAKLHAKQRFLPSILESLWYSDSFGSLEEVFQQFLLFHYCNYDYDIIGRLKGLLYFNSKLRKFNIIEKISDALKNNSRKFQKECKLSLSCTKCIINKLFPI